MAFPMTIAPVAPAPALELVPMTMASLVPFPAEAESPITMVLSQRVPSVAKVPIRVAEVLVLVFVVEPMAMHRGLLQMALLPTLVQSEKVPTFAAAPMAVQFEPDAVARAPTEVLLAAAAEPLPTAVPLAAVTVAVAPTAVQEAKVELVALRPITTQLAPEPTVPPPIKTVVTAGVPVEGATAALPMATPEVKMTDCPELMVGLLAPVVLPAVKTELQEGVAPVPVAICTQAELVRK